MPMRITKPLAIDQAVSNKKQKTPQLRRFFFAAIITRCLFYEDVHPFEGME